MGVTQGGKIKVDVEATTDRYVSAMGKAEQATNEHKKAVDKNSAALRKASLEFNVQRARIENLEKTYGKFDARLAQHNKELRANSARMKKLGGSALGVASKLGNVATGASVAFGALKSLAQGAADVANESLQVQNVFKNLPFSLDAARKSSQGLADDMTLATNAIKANQAKVATTPKAYAELVGTAQTLALKMGRDVSETVQRVTEGIAKQEREILDELVVLPKMNEILGKYAKQNDLATTALTAEQQQAAFTEAALDALSAATEGVDISTTGLAGSVQRTAVNLKNLKTRLLGGEEGARSLRDGLLSLDESQLRVALSAGKNRIDALLTDEALREQNVSADKLSMGNLELADSIDAILKAEAKRIAQRAEQGEATKDDIELTQRLTAAGFELTGAQRSLLAQEKLRIATSERQTAVTAAETESVRANLIVVQDQIALSRARGEPQSDINDLVSFELELKAKLLEAEGDLEKAAKLRRKSELAAISADAARRRKRGGRRGPSALDRQREREARQQAAAETRFQQQQQIGRLQRAIAEKRQRETEALNPFSSEQLEMQLTNVIDFEERRSQIVLDRRLRSIEEQRAAGADPVTLAEDEARARTEHLTVVQEAEDARLGREIFLAQEQGRLADERQLIAQREISQREHQNDIEAIHHEQALRRIAERTAKEKASRLETMRLVKMGADVTLNAAGSVARATILEGQALKKSVAGVARSLAFEHGLKAASEVVNAAIAAASYRYGAAAQHTANAAASAAIAATAGGIAAAAGAGGGSVGGIGGQGAFAGAGAFGPGTATGGTAGADGTPRSGDIGGPVPISQETRSQVSGEAAATGTATTPVVVTQNINVNTLGNPDEETMLKLQQAQRKAGQRIGRLRTGG